jgi:hypothetical protein
VCSEESERMDPLLPTVSSRRRAFVLYHKRDMMNHYSLFKGMPTQGLYYVDDIV